MHTEVILVGDILIAKQDVPEFIEIGFGFKESKSYEIKSIRNEMVDMINEYCEVDSFSVSEKHKGVNYLWDWFKK